MGISWLYFHDGITNPNWPTFSLSPDGYLYLYSYESQFFENQLFITNNPVLYVDKQQRFTMEIYPNPFDDILIINTGPFENGEVVHVFLYNIMGEVIMSKDFINDGDCQVRTSNLTPGLYVIKLSSRSLKISKKVLKVN